MKWQHPPFAQLQQRFVDTLVPPESNANFAFILTALEKSDRCVFIMPNSILTTKNIVEQEIKKYLVEKNLIETIITCPDKMFESTDIATCILVLDKNKTTTTIEVVDLREKYIIEEREQNGQYGGKGNTNRTYKKEVKTFNDEIIDDVLNCVNERKNITGYCKSISIQDVKNNNYCLVPAQYIEYNNYIQEYREYKDILADLNRIIEEKNTCKLTINETLAKTLGFDVDLYKQNQDNKKLNDLLIKISGDKIKKNNYFSTTKNKNEIKFENNSKEQISSIFMMIMNMWKQHIYYLNREENRYLAELRDALLQDLMTGKIEID